MSDSDEECSSTAPERRQLRRAQQHPQIRHGLQSTSRDPIKDFADDVLKDFVSSGIGGENDKSSAHSGIVRTAFA